VGGVVGAAAAKREVVDAQHPRRRRSRQHERADAGQQGVAAAGEAELAQQARPGPAAEREGDVPQPRLEPDGAPAVGHDDPGEALGEDPPPAGRVGAEEAAHAQPQPDGHALPRQVGDGARVPGVHAVGDRAARRAAGPLSRRAGRHDDLVAVVAEAGQPQRGGVGQDRGAGHRAPPPRSTITDPTPSPRSILLANSGGKLARWLTAIAG
jgi:hypothetical protein